LISVMGLVVAMLSVTGVYLWWKKRKARKASQVIVNEVSISSARLKRLAR